MENLKRKYLTVNTNNLLSVTFVVKKSNLNNMISANLDLCLINFQYYKRAAERGA